MSLGGCQWAQTLPGPGRWESTGFPRSGPGSDLGVQPFVSCVLLAKVINISGFDLLYLVKEI